MHPIALGLILSGSLLHLLWNALLKQAPDKLVFLWLMAVSLGVPGLVGMLWYVSTHPVSLEAWKWWVATSVVHSFYFWYLAKAYENSELSFVYPYSRGLGALLATLGGLFLLGEELSFWGSLGVGLTLSATLLEPIFSIRKASNKIKKGFIFTCLTAVSISLYLLIDAQGVKYWPPFLYLLAIGLGAAIGLFPFALPRLKPVPPTHKRKAVGASIFIVGSYGSILWAMTMAPVSYVVAARSSGIFFSALVGVLYLNERMTPIRWIAVIGIFAGVICLGLS